MIAGKRIRMVVIACKDLVRNAFGERLALTEAKRVRTSIADRFHQVAFCPYESVADHDVLYPIHGTAGKVPLSPSDLRLNE